MGVALQRLAVNPAIEQFHKAGESYDKGNLSEAAGHAGAGVLPLVGPWAASLGERASSGDVAGAITEGISGLLVPKVLEKGVKAIPTVAELAKTMETKAVELNTKALKPTNMAKPVGEAVAKAKIWGTKAALPGKIRQAINENTAQVQQAVGAADKAGVTLDVAKALDDAVDAARQRPAFMGDKKALADIGKWKQELSSPIDPATGRPSVRNWTQVKPSEALEMSRGLEKSAGWEGSPPSHIQALATQFRKILGQELDNAAPGVAELRRQNSGLIEAEKAAKQLSDKVAKEQMTFAKHWLSAPNMSKLALSFVALEGLKEMGMPYLGAAGAVIGLRALGESMTSRTARAAIYQTAAEIMTGQRLPTAARGAVRAPVTPNPTQPPQTPVGAPQAQQPPQVPVPQQLTAGTPMAPAAPTQPAPTAVPPTPPITPGSVAEATTHRPPVTPTVEPPKEVFLGEAAKKTPTDLSALEKAGAKHETRVVNKATMEAPKTETERIEQEAIRRGQPAPSATPATTPEAVKADAIAEAMGKLQDKLASAKSGHERVTAQRNIDMLQEAINSGKGTESAAFKLVKQRLQAAERQARVREKSASEGPGLNSTAPVEAVSPGPSPEQTAISLEDGYAQLKALGKVKVHGQEVDANTMVKLLQKQAKEARLPVDEEMAAIQQVLDYMSKNQ